MSSCSKYLAYISVKLWFQSQNLDSHWTVIVLYSYIHSKLVEYDQVSMNTPEIPALPKSEVCVYRYSRMVLLSHVPLYSESPILGLWVSLGQLSLGKLWLSLGKYTFIIPFLALKPDLGKQSPSLLLMSLK